jgi:hypothetical protein
VISSGKRVSLRAVSNARISVVQLQGQALAEVVRAGLSRIEPTAQVFFSPVSLGAGFWLPKSLKESLKLSRSCC